jgi:hypothetical protein
MRVALLFLCSVLPPIAVGDPLGCSNTGLRPRGVLSDSEWRAATHGLSSSEPVIAEAAYLLKKGSDDFSTDERQRASNIDWPQARRLILLGAVNRVNYVPGAAVYIGTRSGKVYMTKVTQPPDLLELVKLVDPCRLYISFWQP